MFLHTHAGLAAAERNAGEGRREAHSGLFFPYLVGEKKTTILYNEQGDKAHELTAFNNNQEVPIGVRLDSDIRYAYQYDSYGNWTERTETRADGSSEYTRRMLTYY